MKENPCSHSDIPFQKSLVRHVKALMTPESLLGKVDFTEPRVIVPDRYPTFDSLLDEREAIRTLKLVPVKNDQQYAHYHAQSREELLVQIQGYFDEEPLVLKQNQFPYYL